MEKSLRLPDTNDGVCQLLVIFTIATSSNCGKPLRASSTKDVDESLIWPRIDLGYGKNLEDWAIRSQVPKNYSFMGKVQRLNGDGSL